MIIEYLSSTVLFPLLERASKRNIAPKVKELREFEKLERRVQKKTQAKYFSDFLKFCNQNVPYYKNIFAAKKFDIDRVEQDIRYLMDLPILTKEIVDEHAQSMKASDAHHVRKTGGSTGRSVFFFYDQEGLDWTAAINVVALDMAGLKAHHRDMHISADSELLGALPVGLKANFYDWVKLRSQNRTRLMVSTFDDASLAKMYSDVKSYRPFLLQGHPSTVFAISDYVSRNPKLSKKLFSIFEPTGEMLTEKMVHQITQNLGCRVANRYGNAEFGVIAHSQKTDAWNKLKVFERAFYVEETKSSDLIVTGITNKGFPLIRYQTGDVGTVVEEESGLFIYDILGRIHDTVKIQNRLWPTHFIMDVLDHKIKGIKEFQIEVGGKENPLLNIVPMNLSDAERILQEVRKVWPEGVDLAIVRLEDLKRQGMRQKFRHVVEKKSL